MYIIYIQDSPEHQTVVLHLAALYTTNLLQRGDMGVSQLLKELKPCLTDCHVERYRGKTVAIDGNAFIFRGAYSCSEQVHGIQFSTSQTAGRLRHARCCGFASAGFSGWGPAKQTLGLDGVSAACQLQFTLRCCTLAALMVVLSTFICPNTRQTRRGERLRLICTSFGFGFPLHTQPLRWLGLPSIPHRVGTPFQVSRRHRGCEIHLQ